MSAFFAYILRHRNLTLGMLVAVTVFFVAQFPRARFATDLFKMFLDDQSIVDEYRYVIEEFGPDTITIVAFDADDLFTPDGLARLQRAVTELEAEPEVERALAVVTANKIHGTEDTLIVRPYMDGLDESPEGLAALRAELASHKLYRDIVLSRDGATAAIVVDLAFDESRRAEMAGEFTGMVDEILAKHGIGPNGRHMLGFVVTTAEVMEQSLFNIVRVFPLAILTVFCVGWLLFRALWPTALTLAVAGLAVVWVIGFAILLSPEVNILVTIVPVVILVLSFADVIHLTNAYLTAVTDELPKEVAILTSASEVGPACLYTSITTLLGFGAFAVVPAAMMRQFALVMAFGTASALFISVTLVPALFSLFPAPAPRRSGLSASHGTPLDKALLWMERLSRTRPWFVVVVTVVAVVACVHQASQLHVETDLVHRFSPEHRLSKAYAYLQDRMASANSAEIIIQTPDLDGVYDPAFLRAVQQMQHEVLALPTVDSALALTDLLELIHREMNPGEVAPGALPDTRELVAQYVLLFSLGGADELEPLVNYERNRLRMAVRLNRNGMGETYATAQEVLAIAERTLPPGVTARATGHMVILGGVLEALIAGQVRGLLSSMATITVVFMLAFRTIRGALGGMIVNFLPLLFFFGTIRWFDSHFDSDYIVVAAVALGIAVDDTIHFLHRYRIELARALGDVDAAILATIEHTGKPIVQTTLVIVFGFAAFNLTSYTSARAFGAMLGSTLVWALLADLLLLPVLIRAGLLPIPAAPAKPA